MTPRSNPTAQAARKLGDALNALENYRGPSLLDAGRLQVPVQLLPNFPLDLVPVEKVLIPAKEGDAGRDLFAAEDVVIAPGQTKLIKTGLAIALPDRYSFEAQVRPTSGNALKLGLTVLNSPGTIDAGYRGEIGVIAHNVNPVFPESIFDSLLDVLSQDKDVAQLAEEFDLYRNEKTVTIIRGKKVAQLVFASFVDAKIQLVQELPESDRGTAGFGSTGTAA